MCPSGEAPPEVGPTSLVARRSNAQRMAHSPSRYPECPERTALPRRLQLARSRLEGPSRGSPPRSGRQQARPSCSVPFSGALPAPWEAGTARDTRTMAGSLVDALSRVFRAGSRSQATPRARRCTPRSTRHPAWPRPAVGPHRSKPFVLRRAWPHCRCAFSSCMPNDRGFSRSGLMIHRAAVGCKPMLGGSSTQGQSCVAINPDAESVRFTRLDRLRRQSGFSTIAKPSTF